MIQERRGVGEVSCSAVSFTDINSLFKVMRNLRVVQDAALVCRNKRDTDRRDTDRTQIMSVFCLSPFSHILFENLLYLKVCA